MRGIAGLIGAVLCMLAFSTCGTYRAITDDYASDAPVVQEVRPTAGVSGESVTFDTFLCVGKAFTGEERYIWNFGGGAYPNTSFDPQPTVTLRDGQNSPYTCKVTITGGCVGDDDVSTTYDFTLNVAPLGIATVTPTIGTGKATATFSALVSSGVVTKWQWDFGGACSPGGSTEMNPVVTFTDVPEDSIFNCRVIASNQFEAIEIPFQVNVRQAPATN